MESIRELDNKIDQIWSEIQRVIGLHVVATELEKTSTLIRFQLSDNQFGQPLSTEQHEQFKNLFIRECDSITEGNISLLTTPSELHPNAESENIVNLFVALDKNSNSE